MEVKDDSTVVFKLKEGNDQIFPRRPRSHAGPIVDEEVFAADKLMSDDDIVKGKPFAGQYTIESYKKNELVSLKANPDYQGVLGKPANDGATIKYYADSNNLKLDVQQGNIDVAGRSLTATDVDDLEKDSKVKVHEGPGGELRYIVFNFDTMPFGAKAADADPAKALAVRQAIANLVDRDAIASQVYKGTYLPAYSVVPDGFVGAIEPLKDMYGDGNGKPSLDKAKKAFSDAGVTDPRHPEPAVQPGPLRQVLRRRVRHDQGAAGEVRPVQGRPAVHRVGHLLQGPHQGRLPAFTSSAGSRTTPTPTTT